VLDLPPRCNFHGFISHTWGTGQVPSRYQALICARSLRPVLPSLCRPTATSMVSSPTRGARDRCLAAIRP
jgi:hypothetical protein